MRGGAIQESRRGSWHWRVVAPAPAVARAQCPTPTSHPATRRTMVPPPGRSALSPRPKRPRVWGVVAAPAPSDSTCAEGSQTMSPSARGRTGAPGHTLVLETWEGAWCKGGTPNQPSHFIALSLTGGRPTTSCLCGLVGDVRHHLGDGIPVCALPQHLLQLLDLLLQEPALACKQGVPRR